MERTRFTKIVATIGPTSRSRAMIARLVAAGVNVTRLNFSHGSLAEHAQVIATIRKVAAEAGKPICILQDLQGPKIRVGALPEQGVRLEAGQEVTLTTGEAGAGEIPVDFAGLPGSVEAGGRILLDDGNLQLTVVDVLDKRVQAVVKVGGILRSHKGINLPGGALNVPAMSAKDEQDLKFGLDQGVDMVALSFVRQASDVEYLRRRMKELNAPRASLPVIAKLERPEAIQNLHEILKAVDGVMVARGDLGVEMSPEEVPTAQKRIIGSANRAGKLVITATQMLESMIHNPRPTRAEASDVANAIYDGTDAVMLSGETAMGDYPVEAVNMMSNIIREAEEHMDEFGHWEGLSAAAVKQDDTYYTTLAARQLAYDRNVSAIAIFTRTGRSALLMSKTRPNLPILAFTPVEETYRRMGLHWGVTPSMVPHANTIEEMITHVEAAMLKDNALCVGEQVVLICGYPVKDVRPTNLALLHTIGG